MEFVQSGMFVGLGTGSTVEFFLQSLARAIHAGRLREIRGVPTSLQSERRSRELGIPLTTITAEQVPDVTIDGADEIDPHLDLIKGLGGALLREKIVAQNSRKLVIIADAGKRVDVLGSKAPVPVEVVPFCHEGQIPFLQALGAKPALRRSADGQVFVTDNGNYIYDCRFDQIKDPAGLESKLVHRAGVVQCGLFIGMATVALVADDAQVNQLRR